MVLVKKAFLIYVWCPFQGEPRTRLEVPVISIESTNICNSKCVFCPNSIMRRKRQAMSMELFQQIIEEYVAMGGTLLTFDTVIGEPLLDPHLLERARVVRRHSQITENGFVTTLQWLHRLDIEEFFQGGFTWLSISTVLTGPESYHAFFGVDLYEPMRDNLIRLLEKNRTVQKPIRITVDIKPTGEPLQKIRAHPDFHRVQALLRPGIDTLFEPVMPILNDDWLGAIKLPSYMRLRPLFPRPRRPCRLLDGRMMIFSNGAIGACSCRDFEAESELIVGRAGSLSLREAWAKIGVIWDAWLHDNVIPPSCARCRHYVR